MFSISLFLMAPGFRFNLGLSLGLLLIISLKYFKGAARTNLPPSPSHPLMMVPSCTGNLQETLERKKVLDTLQRILQHKPQR